MRAEPMAYRTLPAFLELVQRSRGANDVKLRGILLTLPEGEEPGGRWERELRGRLGARILPLVVPYDEKAAQAALFGQIVSQASPEAPAAQSYHALVEHLGLSADVRETIERTSGTSALLLASASLKNAAARRGPARPAPAPVPVPEPRREPDPEPVPEVFAPSRRVTTPVHPIPSVPSRPRTPPVTGLAPVAEAPAPAPAPVPAVASAAQPEPARGYPLALKALWVAVAIGIGVGMRFLKLPDFMIPVLIGIGVGAAVVVLARYLMTQDETPQPENKPGTSGPAPPRKPTATGRLSGLKRRPKAPARDVRGN
jgi:hypothetical protein